MSQEDLIASLRSEGSLDTRGYFKLDAEKAREKLRKFQLEDPHHYVLEFVAAATLLGATRIDVVASAGEMVMTFDGDSLSPAQLEDLYSAAFVRSADATERAMRLLAIGATAAGALDFSILTIESGAARLDILDSGASLTVAHVDTPRDHTRIYMRERLRIGHLVDFLSNLRGDLAEKTALRERCLYSHVAITLDGELISHGHTLPVGTQGAIAFETEHEGGVLGFLPSEGATEVHMLQHGVLVSSYHTDASLVGVRAVVESDRLTKNLSQSAFVEDDAWHDVFHNVLRVTMHASLAEHLRGRFGLRGGGASMPVESLAMRAWLRELALHVFDEVARWRAVSATPSPQTLDLARALERACVWEVCDRVTVDGSLRTFISLEEARALGNALSLSFANVTCRELVISEDFSPVLLLHNAGQNADVLTRYTGLLRRSAAFEIQVMRERKHNTTKWSRNPHDGTLDAAEYPIQASMSNHLVEVTVGRRADGSGIFESVLVHDGHVLRRHHANVDGLRGVTVVISGTLPLDRRHQGIAVSEPYARAVAPAADLVFEVVERAFEASPDRSVGLWAHARQVLQSLASDRALESIMTVFGVKALFDEASIREQMLASMSGVWSLHEVLGDSSSFAGRAAAIEPLGAFATRPLIPVFGGGEAVSLLELMRAAEEEGSVWILAPEEVDAELRRDWVAADIDRHVIADENWVDVVRAYCSPFTFRCGDVIRNTAERKRFLARPKQPVEVEPGEVLARRSLAGQRSDSGEIVMRSHSRPGSIRARLFVSGRVIDSIDVQVPVGRFDAALERSSLRIDREWKGLERDDAFTKACALLREESFALVERRLTTLQRNLPTWGDAERAEFIDYLLALNTSAIQHTAATTVVGLVESIEGFACVGDEAASYKDVRSALIRHGRRLLVMPSTATVDASYIPEGMHEAPILFIRSDSERHALKKLFDGVFIDVGHTEEREAEARRAHASFMRRAPIGLERADALASVDVRAGRFVGRLHALPSDASDMRGRVDVIVRHEERLLVRLSHPVEMGVFMAVVDVEGLRPSTDYSGPQVGVDLATSCAALELPALELLRDVIGRARFGQDLCAAFGERALRLLTYARQRCSTRFERSLLASPTLTLHHDVACSVNALFERCADEATIYTVLGSEVNGAAVPEGAAVLCLRDPGQLAAATALFAEFEFEDHGMLSVRGEVPASLEGSSDDADTLEAAPVTQVPPAASPEALLLERVRGALTRARGSRLALLGDEDLAHLELAPLGGSIAFAIRGSRTVRVDLEHPVARAALAHPDDPIALHMLASSIYSEINAREERITDTHEADLLRSLARLHLDQG